MKSELKKLKNSQVELTITVPYIDYKKAENEALEFAGKNIKVDGFRSGHIPEDVIREKLDDNTLQSATLDVIVPRSYSQAVKEGNLQVINQPKVEIVSPVKKEGDDFVYKAVVPVMPEVKVGDYKKIKVARSEVKVSKKQINETVSMIMDRFAEWDDVKRKAKNGDRAETDFEGFDTDGKAIENTASKNHPIILGGKNMVSGFEDAIVGMEVGGEKEFDVTFPKEYHSKQMQGKKVKFKLKLNRLEEKKKQELNEALIEKITGQKQSVDDFRKRVEEDLLLEMQSRARNEHDSKVVREIIKITKADIPEILIEDEIEHMKKEQQERIKQQGLTWERYLQHIKKTEEDFAKDHKKGAEERLLARLGVNNILKDAKIEITDTDIDKKLKEMSASYTEDQQKQFFERYKKGSDAYRNLKNSLASDQLIEMLTK